MRGAWRAPKASSGGARPPESFAFVLDLTDRGDGGYGGGGPWVRDDGRFTKHVLLAEVDPLHSGVISVSRFLDKLENFRERAKILGLGIFHRHDKEIASDEQEAATAASEEESGDDNGKDRDRCTPADASSRLAKPSNIKSSNTTAPAVPGVVLALESVHSQSRMVELEALIFTMAKRQQELALALSASEVHSCPLIYPVV